jgi:hypothetical protein
MREETKKKVLDILEVVKVNPDLYEAMELTDEDIDNLIKEVKEDKERVKFTRALAESPPF